MTDSYELVRSAILARKQIAVTYDGHEREMCPHAIGTKNGRAQALFFQFAGGSSQGLPPGGQWRCLSIEGLSDVAIRDGAWHTNSNHSQPSTCLDEIDVEVDY